MNVDIDFIEQRLGARTAREIGSHVATGRSAVALILRDEEQRTEVLLIRRAERAGDPWSGHMGFPGGRMEPEDPDVLATAVRETREEVGVDLSAEARLIGRLDDLPAIARGRTTGLVISPFVFRLARRPTFQPNVEVAEITWADLAPMASGACATTIPYVYEGRDIELPAFDVEGRIVWGLTHRMLEGLFAILGS
jgi:8-oxo-dGTP pyrophosphatase MutT (NUDIX family)